jgi:hypothetical protein
MDPDAPADDNKYTIGLAAAVCLLPLPAIYVLIRPFTSALYTPWTPWLVEALFLLTPLLTAFVILYRGPWRHDWSRPKRVLLGMLLSAIIVGVDLMVIGYIFVISCFEFGNILFADPITSRGVY